MLTKYNISQVNNLLLYSFLFYMHKLTKYDAEPSFLRKCTPKKQEQFCTKVAEHF